MVKTATSINDCEREEEQREEGQESREAGAFRCFDEVMGQLSTLSTLPDIRALSSVG